MDREYRNQKGANMAAFDEEYTKWTAKNLGSNDGVSEWVLWLGSAVVIGFLVAILYGLSGSAELASARDGHLAEALRLSETAPQR
jgi:hypothetical protein